MKYLTKIIRNTAAHYKRFLNIPTSYYIHILYIIILLFIMCTNVQYVYSYTQ